ncbi:MAG: hypothetical protein DHS20C18_14260 [Saprospiraceae bacterium]|nr:MAG: hypothetical protein DHS20C18_14260 [Saprospiraceae bacterium]
MLFFLLSITACYENKQGCLDINATNFDPSADEYCKDVSLEECCSYPSLQIQLQHRIVLPDTVYRLVYNDSVYYDAIGQPFRIRNIQYYLSNFQMVRADGSIIRVNDQVELDLAQSGDPELVTFIEDWLLANGNFGSVLTVGDFRETGQFDKLRFDIGLYADLNRVNPFDFAAGNPLAVQADTMYNFQNGGYYYTKTTFLQDTIATDTLPRIITTEIGDGLIPVEIDLPNDFNHLEGFNLLLTLRVDYLSWFATVNVRADTEEEIAAKFVQQIADSFSLFAIESK